MKFTLIALILVVIVAIVITPIVDICVTIHLLPVDVFMALLVWWFFAVVVTLSFGGLYPEWYVKLYAVFCVFWIYFCFLVWGGAFRIEWNVHTGALGYPAVLAPLIPLWYLWYKRGWNKILKKEES